MIVYITILASSLFAFTCLSLIYPDVIEVWFVLFGFCTVLATYRIVSIYAVLQTAKRRGWELDRREVMQRGYLLRLDDRKRIRVYDEIAVLPSYHAQLTPFMNLLKQVRYGNDDVAWTRGPLQNRLRNPLVLAATTFLYAELVVALLSTGRGMLTGVIAWHTLAGDFYYLEGWVSLGAALLMASPIWIITAMIMTSPWINSEVVSRVLGITLGLAIYIIVPVW